MKNVWYLVWSVVQLVFGVLAIASFIVIAANGESVLRWILTLLFAIVMAVSGVMGIVNYIKLK